MSVSRLIPILLLGICCSTCGPSKQYYKFRSILPKQQDQEADSIQVLSLLAVVDSSHLLPSDKEELLTVAKEDDLQLSMRQRSIKIDKYIATSNDPIQIEAEKKEAKKLRRKYYFLKYQGTQESIRNKSDDSDRIVSIVLLSLVVSLLGFFAVRGLVRGIEDAWDETTSNCYIATACYGDYDADEVMVLRAFRDNILKKYFLGKAFIRVYYTLSPPVAKYLSKASGLNRIVRIVFLDPLVKIIRLRQV